MLRTVPSCSTLQPGRRARVWLGLLVLALLALRGWPLVSRPPIAEPLPARTVIMSDTPTAIDSELAPLLHAHPGQTGALVLGDGIDAFAARATTARMAGRSLDLQYFIWHNDLTGRLLANEVHQAAERGVHVRILLDDMNAYGLDPHLLAMDAHPRIELRLYNPIRSRGGIGRILELLRRPLRINHRMHNKAWIADGQVAIVGGRNLGDHYFSAGQSVNFRDLDLLLVGPAVAQASTVFQQYWDSAAAIPMSRLGHGEPVALRHVLARVRRDANRPSARRYLDHTVASASVRRGALSALPLHWSANIQVVADPPLKWQPGSRGDWLVGRLTPIIDSARQQALVISPYFIPGEDGTARLAALTRRGVRVGVVTNSLAATDVHAVHSGYVRYRTRLLHQGVHLYELRAHALATPALLAAGASLHTKAFVIDGQRGFVGSFNVDPRSKNLNTEMGVLFDDAALAQRVREEYQRLSTPALSYQLQLDAAGRVQWVDTSAQGSTVLRREPHASAGARALVRLLGWLPIEPHL